MAIKLVARMSLKDNLSSPLKRVSRQMVETEKSATRMSRRMQESNKSFSHFGRATNIAGKSISGFGKGIGGLVGGLGSLVSRLNPVAIGLSAIGTAAVGAYGAVKIFNATVGEAMKMQQSQFVISAMFDDEKISSEYMKLMDKIAIKSPLLDSQTMYGNSKSFITASKDLGQLEKMWSLAERLVASDPAQGLEGAIYALRELFSGDSKSIVERFEMPRGIMKDIKNLPLEKQLSELDKYFNKIGLTTTLIDKMGSSALGLWAQVKERFQLIMRDMGEPSLKAVSNFLGKVMDRLEGEDMKKFANWGGKIIENMITGLSNNSIKLYDWFTNLTKDPEFLSKTTLTGKISFIVDDVAEKLRAWYDGGGKDKITAFGSNVAQVMVAAMDATDEIFVLGSKLGNSMWSGVVSGVKKSINDSPIMQTINWALGNPKMEKTRNSLLDKHTTGAAKNSDGSTGVKRSWKSGIDRVPSDGLAKIHKDEAVLNPQDAKAYRSSLGKGGSGNTYNFNINMNGTGSIKKDAEALLMEMARIIEREGGQMAT